jgi:hypothetical protein
MPDTRRILVTADHKKFIVTVPIDSVLSFGPFSPPTAANKSHWPEEDRRGTLRVYSAKKADILAVFSGVTMFRDLSIGYAEEVAKTEGDSLWKDDDKGYVRKVQTRTQKAWVVPELDSPAPEHTSPDDLFTPEEDF